MIDNHMPILVVDDYDTMRRIVSNLLSQLGCTQISEAASVSEALQKLREKAYSLVIADWNMQPLGGLDLLKAVRADATLKEIPFIMVTSESKPDHLAEARAAGVSSYIVKPFNAETLKVKLMHVFGLRA